jgi:hypothetical protein
MWLRNRKLGPRGGVLLDFVLVAALVLLGAFALNYLGVTFAQIVNGASHFFGL